MSRTEQRRRRVCLKGTVHSHGEAVALVSDPGDIAIVHRDTLRSTVIQCPDGCGETITVNLDPRTDKAWRLYRSARGITLFPSVWRDTGCRSHFILWNSVLYWMGIYEENEADTEQDSQLEERVWTVLKSDALTDFVDIADALGEIPWSVLLACHRLVKAHRAIAGVGKLKNAFKRD